MKDSASPPTLSTNKENLPPPTIPSPNTSVPRPISHFKLFTQFEIPDLCGYYRTKFLCDIIQSHILYYKDILHCSSTPKRTLLEVKINMFLCLVKLMDSMYCSSSDYCELLPKSQSSTFDDRRRVTKPFVHIYHTMRDPILLQCLLDLLPKSLPIQQFYTNNISMGMCHGMSTKQLLQNLAMWKSFNNITILHLSHFIIWLIVLLHLQWLYSLHTSRSQHLFLP